jgi:hypothetical protein
MNSLGEIRKVLSAALANPAMFSLVNTRLILRTGVDLSDIKVADDRNPAAIAKVVTALKALGYSPESLALVAQRKA